MRTTITRRVPASPRRGPRRGPRGPRGLLAGTALLLAAAGTAAASATPAAASPAGATAAAGATASAALGPPPVVTVKACTGKKVTGPFVVSGTQVYTNGGKGHKGATVFRSYGPTIAFTLDATTWNPKTTVTGDMDEKEIGWAADDWCANTVRIQVNQDLLIERDFAIDQSYLNAIEAEVQDAVNHGLVVVLNDSTESSAYASKELEPDLYTEFFWLEMARLYGHGASNPQHINGPEHVIFDLFNEPRDSDTSWTTWYYGPPSPFPGPPPNVAYLYEGMETLARNVRAEAPRTLFWIEGPQYSDSFAGMYPHYLIRAGNVVYAIHHPKAQDGKDDTAAWNAAYGYLAEKGIAPVVEGEWTNIGGAGVGNSACWPDAIPAVSNYLKAGTTAAANGYLAAHGFGLSAYTLNSGRMLRQLYVRKNGKLTPSTTVKPLEPTVITKATKTTVGWSCSPGAYSTATGTAGTEGAGQAVYDFFRAENQG
jgi:hypothetical protein